MAFTAVAAVIEGATDIATVAAAVGEVGTAMSVVGAVTGNKTLTEVGGVMGIAGGAVSLASGAFDGAASTLGDATENSVNTDSIWANGPDADPNDLHPGGFDGSVNNSGAGLDSGTGPAVDGSNSASTDLNGNSSPLSNEMRSASSTLAAQPDAAAPATWNSPGNQFSATPPVTPSLTSAGNNLGTALTGVPAGGSLTGQAFTPIGDSFVPDATPISPIDAANGPMSGSTINQLMANDPANMGMPTAPAVPAPAVPSVTAPGISSTTNNLNTAQITSSSPNLAGTPLPTSAATSATTSNDVFSGIRNVLSKDNLGGMVQGLAQFYTANRNYAASQNQLALQQHKQNDAEAQLSSSGIIGAVRSGANNKKATG